MINYPFYYSYPFGSFGFGGFGAGRGAAFGFGNTPNLQRIDIGGIYVLSTNAVQLTDEELHEDVSLEDIRQDMFHPELYDRMHVYNFMVSAPAYVYIDEKMDRVMDKFEKTMAWNLPVVDHDRTYVGFVSKSNIFAAYRNQLKQVSHD